MAESTRSKVVVLSLHPTHALGLMLTFHASQAYVSEVRVGDRLGDQVGDAVTETHRRAAILILAVMFENWRGIVRVARPEAARHP